MEATEKPDIDLRKLVGKRIDSVYYAKSWKEPVDMADIDDYLVRFEVTDEKGGFYNVYIRSVPGDLHHDKYLWYYFDHNLESIRKNNKEIHEQLLNLWDKAAALPNYDKKQWGEFSNSLITRGVI